MLNGACTEVGTVKTKRGWAGIRAKAGCTELIGDRAFRRELPQLSPGIVINAAL